MSETIRGAGLQDQCCFYDRNRIRSARANLIHPFIFMSDHRRMNNGVEFLHARRRASVVAGLAASRTKRRFREFRTVDGPVRIKDFSPKALYHFLVDRPPRLHKPMRNRVGLDPMRTELHKHLAYGCFAASDSASQPNLEQANLTLDLTPTPTEIGSKSCRRL